MLIPETEATESVGEARGIWQRMTTRAGRGAEVTLEVDEDRATDVAGRIFCMTSPRAASPRNQRTSAMRRRGSSIRSIRPVALMMGRCSRSVTVPP